MNRTVDRNRVRTAPINSGRQPALVREMDNCQNKLVIQWHREVAKLQSAKENSDQAWSWMYPQSYKIGAAVALGFAEVVSGGYSKSLAKGIVTCRKLRAAAAAGVLPRNDDELAEVRRLARCITI